MPYSFFDLTRTKLKPELYLATPQKKIIAKLFDAHHINLTVKMGKINELNFYIPYDEVSLTDETNHDIESGLSIATSSVIDKIKDRFLIKLKFGDYIEWFIIREQTDDAGGDIDNKIIHCFSLGYELKNIKIMQYEVVSYNVLEILKGKPFDSFNGILHDSLWSVGHVDEELLDRHRTYECTSKNGLDILIELQETFDFIPDFDTEHRMISLYHIDNIGQNRGLKFDYGKYLRNLGQNTISDEIVTRLKIYGRDDLTIRLINPLGTDYIEDYSYFLYPYDGITITYSDYMSTELCVAITAYQDKIRSYTPQFTNLIAKLEILNQLLIVKNVELITMQNELKLLKDNLSIAERAESGGTTIQYFQNKIDEKELSIEKQKENIEYITTQIETTNDSLDDIKDELSEKNNFSLELLEEKKLFTIEDDFTDTNIAEETELYKAALEYFQEVNKPKTSINIDIINFLDVLEEQDNWDKLVLGDIIKIKYNKFNVNTNVRIVEISYDFENDNVNLTITNLKDFTFTNDVDALSKLIHRSTNIIKAIKVSKPRWDKVNTLEQSLDDILSNPWETLRLEDEVDWDTAIDLTRVYDEIEAITMPEVELPDFDNMFNQMYAEMYNDFEEMLANLEILKLDDVWTSVEEYYEYTLADWNPAGIEFYFVQEYEDEPAVQITLQGDTIGTELNTYAFQMVAEHIRGDLVDPLDATSFSYIGLTVTPEGSSIPAVFSGKVSIAAVCKGLVVEETAS